MRYPKASAFVLLIGALMAVSLVAAVFAQQQTPEATNPPTGSNQTAILVTTVAGFLSMLVAQLFQFYRENRNRKWDLQDRKGARTEMRQHAETQRLETIQTAIEIARVSNINRQHILGAIDKNNELTTEARSKSDAAYVAATEFTSKLDDLHEELKLYAGAKKAKG